VLLAKLASKYLGMNMGLILTNNAVIQTQNGGKVWLLNFY
jgi:hypothetical protein